MKKVKPLIVLLLLKSCILLAAPTLAPKAKEANVVQKTEELVNKALVSTSIANAHLRVEGAQFRAFNLYMPAFVIGDMSAAEKKNFAAIREIVERDLAISGHINLVAHSAPNPKLEHEAILKQKGIEGRSTCRLGVKGQKITALLEHKNLLNGKETSKLLELDFGQYRRLAHVIAQSIFEEYIGPEDIFVLQIAAVKQQKNFSQVVLFDFDGKGETTVSSGSWEKSGPAFADNGTSLLYTVVSDQGQAIVEQHIGKPNIVFRSKYPGLNLDPTPFSVGKEMLVTLSLGKSVSNIFKMTRGGELGAKVTDNIGTNLSPDLSPDAKSLVFVSTRGGSWQIYEQALAPQNGVIAEAKRLSMEGRFNQTPRYSSDGRMIAFTTKNEEQEMNVAILERESGRVSYVTRKQGRNQEPRFSPSGRFVIFSSERGSHRKPEIYLATINGDHQYRLTNDGGYYSPVIRPQQK